jgi:hypothetical protein
MALIHNKLSAHLITHCLPNAQARRKAQKSAVPGTHQCLVGICTPATPFSTEPRTCHAPHSLCLRLHPRHSIDYCNSTVEYLQERGVGCLLPSFGLSPVSTTTTTRLTLLLLLKQNPLLLLLLSLLLLLDGVLLPIVRLTTTTTIPPSLQPTIPTYIDNYTPALSAQLPQRSPRARACR